MFLMKIIKKLIKNFLEFLFLYLASASRFVAGATHFCLYIVQWGIKPTPDWFDHNIDIYWKWWRKGDSSWVERGVLNSICLRGGAGLELTCGDGFYTSRFYAAKLDSVIACDRDPRAIEAARNYNWVKNINYVVADIITEMPSGEFQNIIWDFGFPWCNFFSTSEVDSIVTQCKDRLLIGGVFSGYLALLSQAGVWAQKSNSSAIDFKNVNALKNYLLQFFPHVSVIETFSPGRHNAYFFASNNSVLFADIFCHKH
jgi:hypothetical protein